MTTPVNFYADFKGLSDLKVAAAKQDPTAVREAARQFEGVFTKMLLKSMRDASLGESMMDSDQTKFYQDMFDNQLAMQLSRGRGLGLADLLTRQLTEAGLKSGAGAAAKTTASPASTLIPLTFAPTPVPVNQSSVSQESAAPKTVTQPLTQSVTQRVTKGGAEGGIKDIHGVTPSAPNFTRKPPTQPQSAAPISQSNAQPASPSIKPSRDLTSRDLTNSDASRSDATSSNAKGPRQSIAQSPADFISAMWPHAQKAARELGVDPKTLIAHAALETGWGKFVPCNPDGSCSYNLFGIKAGKSWKGASVDVNTLEYEKGIAVRVNDQFRSYDSAADSFRDYAKLLKNSARYENALGAGQDAVKFATALQQGGYATDPAYADKLAAAAHRIGASVPGALSGDALSGPLSGQPLGKDSLKNLPVQPLASGRGVSGVSATIRQTGEI